jgi:hypothetical protein
VQLTQGDLAAALLFLAGDAEFLTLVLQLAPLQEQGPGDADEGDPGEEHAYRCDCLPDLRPAIERPIAGVQEQNRGNREAGDHPCNANGQGKAGQRGLPGAAPHQMHRAVGKGCSCMSAP